MAKKPRSNVKYPGLVNKYNSKIKQEYMDQDYIGDLTEEEKSWLNDFNEEYYGANLDFKNLENNRFHKTQEDKKACTDRNNARNRCLYGNKKAGNKTVDIKNNDEPDLDRVFDMSLEDAIIDVLDEKKKS